MIRLSLLIVSEACDLCVNAGHVRTNFTAGWERPRHHQRLKLPPGETPGTEAANLIPPFEDASNSNLEIFSTGCLYYQ